MIVGLDRLRDQVRFRLAGGDDDRGAIRIVCDGSQADGDDQALAGRLDPAQVSRGGGLRLVVDRAQARRGMVVRAFDIESDVAVRADTAEEETDAAQLADAMLVLHTPLIDRFEHEFLSAFKLIGGLTVAERQVHMIVGPDLSKSAKSGFRSNLRRIDKQSLRSVEPESLDVEVLDVIVEAVVL